MIEEAKNRNVHKGHQDAHTIAEIEAGADTALVVVESQQLAEIVIGSPTLLLDRTFATAAVRSGEESRPPRDLGFRTGNNPMFGINGTTPLEAAAGFFLDQPNKDELFPDDYDLMDAMDALCEQGKAREVVVMYQDRETKRPNPVPSWQLYEPSLFVVCQEILGKSAMESNNSDRWGIAYVGWRPGKDGHSRAKFHCFIQELMNNGYSGMFAASFSSFLTPKILDVLNAQHYVLKFANDLRARLGDTMPLPPYGFAIPVKKSLKTLTAKNAETGDSKELYYPVPGIPRLSERDPGGAAAYLRSKMITDEQQFILEAGDRIAQMSAWSVRETSRMLAGKDGEDNGLVPTGRDDPQDTKDDHPF